MLNNKKNNLVVFLLACFCLSLLLVRLFFQPLSEWTDTLSLFNPVYMTKYYHRVVYPIYNCFENMPVHPPLHYYIAGLLYTWTGNLHTAITLPTFAIGIIMLLIVLQSSFGSEKKIALFCSIAMVFNIGQIIIRPDFTLSLWWFSGLLLLEDGREKKWNLSRLAGGSFMLGLSTCMHYFASFAFLGVLVYAYQLYREQPTVLYSNKRMYALVIPAGLVVSSYLLFQILPNYTDIKIQVSGNKTDGNIIRSLQVHWGHFHFPPPCLLAILLFFVVWHKSLLHIASLPLTLFVLCYSTMKSGGYYIPELFIFYTGGYLLFFTLIRKFPVTSKFKTVIIVLFLLTRVSSLWPSEPFQLQPESELITARASAQHLFGANQGIASRMDLWYVCGAHRSYNILKDLFWKSDIADVDVKKYFGQFDLIAEHGHMSNNTLAQQQLTLSDWYLDSTLHAAGFYLTNNSNSSPTGFPSGDIFPFMLFSITDSISFRGIQCVNNNQLFLYEKTDTGAHYVFISTVLKKETDIRPVVSDIEQCNSFALSNKSEKPEQMNMNVKSYLFWGIIKADSLTSWNRWATEQHIQYRDFINLKRSSINKDSLLKEMHQNDKPIQFYKNIDDWNAGKAYYN